MAPLRRSERALLSPFYSSFIIVLLVVIIALHLLPPPSPSPRFSRCRFRFISVAVLFRSEASIFIRPDDWKY